MSGERLEVSVTFELAKGYVAMVSDLAEPITARVAGFGSIRCHVTTDMPLDRYHRPDVCDGLGWGEGCGGSMAGLRRRIEERLLPDNVVGAA